VLTPALTAVTRRGVTVLTDPDLRARAGVLVAFTYRTGGRSSAPYEGLDLAAHVGDDPAVVDENRAALFAALDIETLRDRLTMAEQVHGLTVRVVTGATAGMGAHARPGTPPAVPATDALVTIDESTPIMLCYADCVPIVLVATAPVRGVAVVHAGWRGALAGIAADAARRLAAETGCEPCDLLAYVGPHIGACCYEVDATLLSHFVEAFGTIAAAQGRLDLGAVISESLNGVGVPVSSKVRAGVCTAERTYAFYSYRAEGLTGRHGALACILGTLR
jgi:YfiH family protein